jgi:D-aminoacyl-tRNA deacylase
MKVILQRVSQASVRVDNQIVGQIQQGLLLLVGFTHSDTEADLSWTCQKIINMRIFADENQKMNLSIKDIQGQILCISQFTLFADYQKGNRPSFTQAAKPEQAKAQFEQFKHMLQAQGITVASGIFGANMQVSLCNDGPVSICVDSN